MRPERAKSRRSGLKVSARAASKRDQRQLGTCRVWIRGFCRASLGEKVMARTFERQVAELNIRAAILNRFTELCTPQTVAMA